MKKEYINKNKSKRLVVLGANGMLGNTILRFFALDPSYEVFGTVRRSTLIPHLQQMAPTVQLVPGIDVLSLDSLTRLFADIQPNVVINCIGVVKQLSDANDPLTAVPINALLPHRLARLAQVARARLIHMSTDCVFSGKKGNYTEDDFPDAEDLYGRSKLLGEVDYPNAITLRTSIIGHELAGTRSLIDWFLSQSEEIQGYKNAIFSGLPTVEIARIIHELVIPNPTLHGLYHLSAAPISKFDLLSLVAKVYGKDIKIKPSDEYVIDRSLNSDRFSFATGFQPASWEHLVRHMHAFRYRN
jgi:dTDP-4-dehydrorhamnose reductase